MALRHHINVLVVDDMSTSRSLIAQALEKVGIQNVTLASDAKEALGQIIKASVNLVISDFNMPDRDGLDLLQKIRSMPGGEKIAFILITGKTSPDIITRGKQLGMNNFVAKPFDVAQMRQAIEAVVGRI